MISKLKLEVDVFETEYVMCGGRPRAWCPGHHPAFPFPNPSRSAPMRKGGKSHLWAVCLCVYPTSVSDSVSKLLREYLLPARETRYVGQCRAPLLCTPPSAHRPSLGYGSRV